MSKTEPKTQMIPISKLRLDRSNPRSAQFGVFPNEQQVIDHLTKHEKVYEMAKHIAEHGLSPIELVAIVRNGTNLTVQEGNRRVCALKLLNNPGLASKDRQKSMYGNIARKAKVRVPNAIECKVFNSKKDCNLWMDLKHSSGQPAGTRKWSAAAKNLRASRNENQLAGQLLIYAKQKGLINDSDLAILQSKITTLTRYLSTPSVRDTLGITSPSNLLVQWKKESAFKKLALEFLKDGIDDVLSSRTKAVDREEYAAILKRKVPHDNQQAKSARNLASAKLRKKSQRISLPPQKKKIRLIPTQWAGYSYLEIGNTPGDTRLALIIKELRDLNFTKYPFAAAGLFRLLMERCIRRYLGVEEDSKKTTNELHKAAYKKLKKDKGAKFAQALGVALDHKHSLLSYHTQCAWVHGTLTPGERELSDTWDNFEPILVEFLKEGRQQQT